MSDGDGPLPLPPAMPQFRQNAGRRLCAWLLHRCGWQVAGTFPDCAKLVLIAAPHTSWWDGVWGLLFKVALGIDIAFMAKRELFRGPLGWLLRRLGGMPIERSAAHGLVEQIVARVRSAPRLWIGIAPQGTRRRSDHWKTGFWHIARRAGVPILPVAFDYAAKTIRIGPLFQPSADLAADLASLTAFYAPFRGRNGHADRPLA
jgi:1-acyl-sn-glycerol-3-phosphate acyltransferase